MTRDRRRRLLFALGAVAVCWGLNWVVMKTALRDMAALDFAALRLWLASAVLFGTLALLRMPLRVPRPGALVLTGLFQTGLTTALTLWALAYGSASKNAVLCYTMPFWVVLLAWPLLGERPGRRHWVALAIAAAGLGFLVAGGVAGTLADIAAVGAGVSWALGIVLTKKFHGGTGGDPIAFSAWQSLIGAVSVGVLALLLPGKATHWTLPLVLALAYNALLVYGVFWILWFWVLQRLDAGIASLATLAVPVVGVIAGIALLGEQPSPAEWTGMAFVVAALGLTAQTAARGGR